MPKPTQPRMDSYAKESLRLDAEGYLFAMQCRNQDDWISFLEAAQRHFLKNHWDMANDELRHVARVFLAYGSALKQSRDRDVECLKHAFESPSANANT